MRAADGAIEGVRIVDGEVQLTVIGDVEPAGLCGSGLVDAVAELVGAGILDHSGRFVAGSSDRLDKIGEETVFHLHEDVFLSQKDVRELQFAKASIATGWTILCKDLGIEPQEISQVLLGGSFGSYLTAASAVRIGLVPKLPLARIVAAGNVAGEGAKIAALSITERAPRTPCSTRSPTSSSPAAPTSTTCSSTSSRSPDDEVGGGSTERIKVVVACGALALHIDQIAKRRGWELEVRPLPPELHNRPERIRAAVDAAGGGDFVAYADCGTHGALDDLDRLPGADCYELFGGLEQLHTSPRRTTSPTSSCARSTVSSWRGLGLDRHPELREDYFRHYEARRLARTAPHAGAHRAGRGGS